MNLSIYNIQKEYLEIAEILKDNGGEVTEELETALAINQTDLAVKAGQFAMIIKDTEHEVTALDGEIKRLTEMKKNRENSVERLKGVIKTAMVLYGIDEIKTDNIKINFRKSTSVEIEDETLIPAFLKEEVPATYKILKKDIGDVLKAGGEVAGASLSHNRNLQIK